MSWWACFREDDRKAAKPAPAIAKGAQVKAAKVGRNDPCPCGSGKKFKKCCGR
ncbi:SEC-C metal-binding domain-containing protein [Thiorhodococcus mannitoliphagus]|uniref:SEC-C metal-binding domain-containing protein n=1 Tax=Thiorhodococcus mannitoliphagus TaxID=329406 RepID=UPI001F0EFA10|nr:SEC-C metal-binding domain-containing protein [Thiorhodococcus mannitoliphagus]